MFLRGRIRWSWEERERVEFQGYEIADAGSGAELFLFYRARKVVSGLTHSLWSSTIRFAQEWLGG